MLKSLSIKNYAIIDKLNIEFDDGFMCFTGETGAGKSIIVGALTFLLRGRSDTSIIKSGRDKAIVEGVFEIKDKEIISKLIEQDIDVDNNEVIVKRVISSDNRSSIKINQSTVTLSFLQDLFSKYVDIHSQKDAGYLYNKKKHIELLDKYAGDYDVIEDYLKEYRIFKKLDDEYNDLINNTYSEAQIDYLRYDFNELDEAKLSPEEENELESKEKKYKQAEKYLTSLNSALELYNGESGIDEKLHDLLNCLNIDDEEIVNIKDRINNLYYELSENIDSLNKILSGFDDEDNNIEYIEERLYLYSKLKRKHKTDTEGLIKLKDELNEKLRFFDDRDMVLSAKKKERDKAYNNAKQQALKLHNIRIEQAGKLEEEIMKEGRELLLNNLNFHVEINETELTKNGMDNVEFMVSMNKGEELKPLSSVASGGEVSRLLLALKVVLSRLSGTGLMILDEIDTGVSGKVALKVGEKIKKISSYMQVIVISHLAPVAAWALNQYLIYKEDDDTSTHTNVKLLNYEERIEQLAIISNTSTDENALKAAKELLDSCQG